MKRYFTLILLSFPALYHVTSAQIGKVGINTDSPTAMLHVKDSSVVFTGGPSLPGSPGQPPVLGNGIRMMWYPDKAAIRAGGVGATQWDRDSIGNYSSGIGLNTIAKGYGSVALGHTTSATNTASVALGNGTVSSGIAATALGSFTDATGTSSVSMGNSSLASGAISVAMGLNSMASGTGALSIGNNTVAMGNYSSAFGLNTKAKPYAVFVLGRYNDTTSLSSFAWDFSDPLFIIGNGSSDASRNNALTVLKNGRVGINAANPLAHLHVKDSSVLFTGGTLASGTPGDPPATGNGVRMMWYPGKAALRAGMAESGSWEKDSIGSYSMAFGRGSKAVGLYSTATGYHTRAFGTYSTAMNYNTDALGVGSFAMGWLSTASGAYSMAGGYNSIASDIYSVALGYSTESSGDASVSLGYNTQASGSYSTSGGYNSTATNSYSFAFGNTAAASGNTSVSIGQMTEASGICSVAMGFNTDATNTTAVALGYSSIASGYSSFAAGNQTEASGNYSTALGYSTNATGLYSTALGVLTDAMGASSLSTGYNTESKGNYSASMGYQTLAKPYASCVLGRYNDTTSISSTSWNINDPVFIIGNGTSNSSRSNAFTVLKNGDVGIKTAMPVYGLHMTTAYSTDGGWIDGLVIENTATSSTGEAAISMRNAGPGGTGSNFWHMGLNQDRNFRWTYGAGFLGSNTKMTLDTLGNLYVTGTYSSSDENLKKDIHPIDNALQKISLLNGYHYLWSVAGKDPGIQTGVIAQEVQAVMPELVKTNEEGIKSVNYDGLIPYLVESVKALKKENEQLRLELETLKSALDE